MDRRSLILGAAGVLAITPRAFAQQGTVPPADKDVAQAREIVRALPRHTYVDVMQALSRLTDAGPDGQRFNQRWKEHANPLIVRFFNDLGFNKIVNDCTPWCAATLSWCLKRDGRPIPKQAYSSQSFLDAYGTIVATPEPGDIAVFTETHHSDHGHVGIFMGYAANDHILLLGGNQAHSGDTNCGGDYPSNIIDMEKAFINPTKSKQFDLYLNSFVRPPAAV